MNTPEEQRHYERVYQQAVAIMDQEWLDAGKTREELDQERQLITLFGRLLASGRSEEEIDAEWEGKSTVDILRAYTQLDVTTIQHEVSQCKQPVTTLAALDDLAARVGQAWQSEKSVVEVLSEMRR